MPIPSSVLVTGAGGLIGSAICRDLSRKNIKVVALLAKYEKPNNIRDFQCISILRGDIRDRRLMGQLIRDCEAVIHTAALNSLWHKPSDDFYSINVQGTRNVCEAAMEAGVTKFIFTSSCEVMGRAQAGILADEENALSLRKVNGHYERSKFIAEDVVREFIKKGLPATILRPTAVIGPGDIHGTPPGRLIRAFLSQSIPAYYDAGINVVDSRDVALAHIEALSGNGIGKTYIVGAHNIFLRELFEELSRVSGIPAPTRKVSYRIALAAAIMRELTSMVTRKHPGITVSGIRTIHHPWFFDTSKVAQELGVSFRPLYETVKDAVEWHLNENVIARSEVTKQSPD
ncbi:MAG: NAD-dependent epimerase/dehydratase family protein [Pseudomonadota bacterium]